MLLFQSIFLAVSSHIGYALPDDHVVTATGSFLYSCRELGGECIRIGTAKSYAGGTTARSFGQRECSDGFSCYVHSEYKEQNSNSQKKRKRKKRQASGFDSDRAIKCPSTDSDPKCGSPDKWNELGGRCRLECKIDKNNNAEIERPDEGVCPAGNGCKCCFRQRKCKKRKPCTKKKGTCRGECPTGETDMGKGCVNGCTCCVPNDKVPPPVSSLPDCESNGGRCTTKKKPNCDPDRSETLADDKFACKKNSGSSFQRKCCARDLGSVVAGNCEAEGSKCKKKKTCEPSTGERDFTKDFPCPKAAGGKKKLCCLKDCYNWRDNTWYAHGERNLMDCQYAICKNGRYITYSEERGELCCHDETRREWFKSGNHTCREFANTTHYRLLCVNGTWFNDTSAAANQTCHEEMLREEEDLISKNRMADHYLEHGYYEGEEGYGEESDKGDPSNGVNPGGTWVRQGIGNKGIGGQGIVNQGFHNKGIGGNTGAGQRMMPGKGAGSPGAVRKVSSPGGMMNGNGPGVQKKIMNPGGNGQGVQRQIMSPGGNGQGVQKKIMNPGGNVPGVQKQIMNPGGNVPGVQKKVINPAGQRMMPGNAVGNPGVVKKVSNPGINTVNGPGMQKKVINPGVKKKIVGPGGK